MFDGFFAQGAFTFAGQLPHGIENPGFPFRVQNRQTRKLFFLPDLTGEGRPLVQEGDKLDVQFVYTGTPVINSHGGKDSKIHHNILGNKAILATFSRKNNTFWFHFLLKNATF